jgi:chromosome segregation ATPase
MLTLAIPSWLRNAAAALCGRHGAVTQRAEQAGCSRQTVYDHGRQLVKRLAERDQEQEALRTKVSQLQAERDELQQRLDEAVTLGTEKLQRFAVVSQAMGVSLRQAEELLGTLLPAQRVPDHATLGRWTEAAGRRAGEVLAVLDPLCAPAVQTLCVDEIFFGG